MTLIFLIIFPSFIHHFPNYALRSFTSDFMKIFHLFFPIFQPAFIDSRSYQYFDCLRLHSLQLNFLNSLFFRLNREANLDQISMLIDWPFELILSLESNCQAKCQYHHFWKHMFLYDAFCSDRMFLYTRRARLYTEL